jgi:hypothetical protein
LETDKRSREELLVDAAKARRDAQRHRTAALIVHDSLVEETLRTRADELITLAAILEAKASKITP